MSKRGARREQSMDAVIVAECVGCGAKKEILAGVVPVGEHPMCDKCFMPLVALRATTRRLK